MDEAQIVLSSTAACPTTSNHLLIEANDLQLATALGTFGASHPSVTDIECGNELELAPLELDVPTAARFVGDCARTLRAGGYRGNILAASVYTVADAQLVRMKAYRAACQDCGCTFHWYGGDVTEWKDEIDALACPFVAVTEFGAHSVTPAEDQAQLAYYREQVPGFWTIGATLIEAYQRASGPTQSNLDNFGFWPFDLTKPPKPAWEYLRSLVSGN